jgi:uncharacterized protein (DUF4415 family)
MPTAASSSEHNAGMHIVHMRNMNLEIGKQITMTNDDLKRTGSMLTRTPKKARVTLYLDPAVIDMFRSQAAHRGAGYQTLINEALRQTIHPESAPLTVESLRRVLREEFSRYCANQQPVDRQ